MKDKLWWLKVAIMSYLKTHERADNIKITSYMKVRCGLTTTALFELESEGAIEEYWNGRDYEVRLKNDHS